MNRISLPGKAKNKRIILFILILISIGILIYEFINNTKNKNTNKDINNISNEQLIGASEKNNDSITESQNENIKNNEVQDISERERELYNNAYATFFSGDYAMAINKADELVEEFPNSYMGYNIRGIAKAYDGDFDGGMSDINKSLDMNSDYGYGRFNKALTYELYNQFDESLKWYNKALEVEEYVWTYYGIASIYGRRGDVNRTVEYLTKAINMDSAVKEEAKNESDFDPVRNSLEFKNLIEE